MVESDREQTSAAQVSSTASRTIAEQLPIRPPPTKPISALEQANPREYQISQVVKRFSPFRADLDQVTTLKLRVHPTDPDFPFDLPDGLQCTLSVPVTYPRDGRPTLSVQNEDMPRGYQINVEKGFATLASQSNKSLLQLLNELDRHLERFLASEKAATVKFVSNARRELPAPVVAPVEAVDTFDYAALVPAEFRYSADELQRARERRVVEVRQLEARLGRSPLFIKASDGIAYNIPIQIPNSANLPATLRSVREAALIVPSVYPLEPCTIILRGVEGEEAENVEVAFEKRAVQYNSLPLMAHINYLAQNLTRMAVGPPRKALSTTVIADPVTQSRPGNPADIGIHDPSRPHVQYIARPPEWNVQERKHDSDESETEDSDEDSGEQTDSDIETVAGGATLPVVDNTGVERGVRMSFPELSLQGIELLHITSLSLAIKCDRCKQTIEINNIKPSTSTGTTAIRSETCTKCTAMFALCFRPELMHVNSNKAGYIDIENASIVDMLPSTFQPTCAECSEPFPNPPGVRCIPRDSNLSVCRSCHAKMTIRISEVRFLRISSTTTLNSSRSGNHSTKTKENLGITGGTPLPNNGRCTHYAKSYRWFRFSCCNRVYPCDRCHDASEKEHANEHAERMICGWCSREQRYQPDQCRMCGRSVVRKASKGGFWEGGKGTRERRLMNRNDRRKYKRIAE